MKKVVFNFSMMIGLIVLAGCGATSTSVEITTIRLNSQYAALNQAYSQTIEATGGSGAENTYVFSISEGSLPYGLMLNSGSGVISGLPTIEGEVSTFTVRVDDVSAAEGGEAQSGVVTFDEKEYSITVVATPFTPDEFEALGDNNYSTTLNTLSVGGDVQEHNFHLPDDSDFFLVDLTGVAEGTPVMIESNAIEGQLEGNVWLYLKDFNNPTGDPVHYASAELKLDSHAMMFFKKGTKDKFYLFVSSGPQLAYSISMFVYEDDKYESDNSPELTTNVILPGETEYQFHTFTDADEDWVLLDFTNITPGTLYEFFSDHRTGTSFDGTKLELFDADLNLLAENDHRDWVTDSKYARIYWYFEQPGTYYLRMTADSFNADGADLTIGEYNWVHPTKDEYELLNDDGFNTENEIVPGVSQQHTLHVTGDEDFYKLDLSGVAPGSNVLITAGRDAQKSPPGTRFFLYDNNESLILAEWGFNGTASASFTVGNPGVFFVKVDSVYDDTGYYLLTVE